QKEEEEHWCDAKFYRREVGQRLRTVLLSDRLLSELRYTNASPGGPLSNQARLQPVPDIIVSMPRFPTGQTLLIDADDTLWENNIYFERAIAAFISYLNHHEYSEVEVRQALNAVERETILSHGYGITSFTRSLVT